MENKKAFYDLCIQESCYQTRTFVQVANRLIQFGFRTIAINQVLTEEHIEFSKKKKKKKGENRDANDLVPEPIKINQIYKGLHILNRLTLEFSERATVHKVMQCENLKKYHIFAVSPKTSDAFQFACDGVDADIISYNPADSKATKFNRKLYNLALDKGLFFELNYFPIIQDAGLRKNTIARAVMYHMYGKSRNIIITSRAINYLSLRGPYDIANLGLILGLSEEQAKCAISTACTDLLNRAEGRRMGKALIVVKSTVQPEIIELESDEEDMEVRSDEPAIKKTKVIK